MWRRKPKFKIESLTYRVGKLTLRPDDIVVLSTDLMLDKDQMNVLHERAQAWFPDRKVLVLSHGMKLGVIRSEDIPNEKT